MKKNYLKLILVLLACLFCQNRGYGQSYILGDTQYNAGWFKLGSLSLPQMGSDAELKVVAGGGYNASQEQQGECMIHFRTSNDISNTDGFYASGSFYNTGRTKVVSNIRVVQIDLTTWDFYAYLPTFTGSGSVLSLESNLGTWSGNLVQATLPTGVVYADLVEEYFVQSTAYFGDKVGIGTATPDERLSVNGKIHAKEIKVDNNSWPDYVFEPDYKIMPLTALDQYIKTNKHLPDVPTADEVKRNGVNLGSLVATLLKKMEELTLHLIEIKKENVQLKRELALLK